jgi:hypothetical protein
LIALFAALLGAIGTENVDRNAHRDTGLAIAAVGSIDVRTAAPKAEIGELTVDPAVHVQERIDKNSRRRAVFQITARVLVSRVKLNRGYVHRLRLVFFRQPAKRIAFAQ